MAEEQKKTTPASAANPAEPLDPDNVKLSERRIKEIRAKAAQMVSEERLKALEAIELEKALEEIRGKAGLSTGDPVEDALVDITIDIGESTDRIVINGRAFMHGETYTVPRHQARSLMEIMWRTALHEHSITDKPLSALFQRKRQTVISARKGIINAPRLPGEAA